MTAVLLFAGLAALTIVWLRSGEVEVVPPDHVPRQHGEIVTASIAVQAPGEAVTEPAEVDVDADVPHAPAASPFPRLFRLASEAQRPDGSFPMQWDYTHLQTLGAGDTFAIDMPGSDEPYVAMVTNEESFDGSRRLAGRIHDGGIESWPFSLTVSSDGYTVVGNLTTGAGHFAVDADANGGRLRSDRGEALHQEESGHLE